jgi:uncharacterized protein
MRPFLDSPRLAAPLCAAAAALLTACMPGSAADTVRSAPPTAAGAIDGDAPKSCDPDASYDPLVVDLEPEDRGDLEIALKQGVVIVGYDCQSVTLLPDCSLEGEYGYIGMSRKENVVSLRSADEVTANMPFTGTKLLGDLEAGLARGQSLDVAMVMIGKRAAAVRAPSLADLEGDCDGATHYVRDATLGAFAMQSSSSAEVKTAASIFGRGAAGASASSESIGSRDGELEACEQARPDANTPPAQCQSVLRLRLKNLRRDDPAAPSERLELEVASCPPGTVVVDGVCQVPEPDRPHQCEVGDADSCRAMCERGDAASCYVLGSMHRTGFRAPIDLGAAAELLDRACAGEVWAACADLAGLHLRGEVQGHSAARAAELAAIACDAGFGPACVEHGLALLALEDEAPRAGRNREENQAIYRFRRACYGGEYEGCTWVGAMYADGRGGVRNNPRIAARFFEKACKEGSALGCHRLAEAVAAGVGTARDPARAAELHDKACRGGHQPACR